MDNGARYVAINMPHAADCTLTNRWLRHARAAASSAAAARPTDTRRPARYTGSDRSRTGNAVEYLICSIANDELTSNSGTARINCLYTRS